MKKIKYLLLGIVSLFGIGFSFATRITAFEYYYNNGKISYSFDGLGRNLRPVVNYNNGYNTGVIFNYKYGYNSTLSGLLLMSTYLQSGFTLNFYGNYDYDYFDVFFVPSTNFIGLTQHRNSSSTTFKYFYYKFSTGNYEIGDSSIMVSNNDSSFIRVNSDFGNCLEGGWFNGNCIANRFFIHTNTNTYDSFDGGNLISDSIDNGITYNKGPVVSLIGDSYSFFMTDGLNSGSSNFDGVSVIPRIVVPVSNNSNSYYINGVFGMKLNNYLTLNSDLNNYQIILIQVVGIESQNYDFTYSIYNCPGNSYYLSDCSFSDGGYLRQSNSTFNFQSSGDSLFITSNTGRDNLLYLLSFPFGNNFTPNYSSTLYNIYDSVNNLLTIYRPYLAGSDAGVKNRGYSLSLVSTDGINILSGINIPGGNGNQSTGSIAINTGLLNSCLNDLTFGELNSYLCNQLLAHLGNPIQIPGTSGQYISVSIDENGNLKYWITTQEDLEEQMSGFVRVQNDDGTRSTVCPSGDCLGTILAQPIIHGNTGNFELTTGVVVDMITNLTGWVGRCPFPYTDFRLGKNLKLLQLLQDYGFNYDPFIIINCSVAGFHYGRHTIDTILFGDTFEQPLLYGDTQKHRTLFTFLDFVVILGLFGLFAFLKKIF